MTAHRGMEIEYLNGPFRILDLNTVSQEGSVMRIIPPVRRGMCL